MSCTSICDDHFTEILPVRYALTEKGHDQLCTLVYASVYYNKQEIKRLEKLDHAIKEALWDESSDQVLILTIRILDHLSTGHIVVTTP